MVHTIWIFFEQTFSQKTRKAENMKILGEGKPKKMVLEKFKNFDQLTTKGDAMWGCKGERVEEFKADWAEGLDDRMGSELKEGFETKSRSLEIRDGATSWIEFLGNFAATVHCARRSQHLGGHIEAIRSRRPHQFSI